MVKTSVADEVKERIDYFEDWLVKLSSDKDKSNVVNEKTALEFIRTAFLKDASLRNLVDGMDAAGGYDALLQGSYIQSLIQANRAGEKLDKSVGTLKQKRKELEKDLPARRKTVIRKKVVDMTLTNNVLKLYGIKKSVNKNGIIQYRDLSGRFVKNDSLLRVTDRVISSSARKRQEFDDLYRREVETYRKNHPKKTRKKSLKKSGDELDVSVEQLKKDSDELDELLHKNK